MLNVGFLVEIKAIQVRLLQIVSSQKTEDEYICINGWCYSTKTLDSTIIQSVTKIVCKRNTRL